MIINCYQKSKECEIETKELMKLKKSYWFFWKYEAIIFWI